jgi:hypothetical protein
MKILKYLAQQGGGTQFQLLNRIEGGWSNAKTL